MPVETSSAAAASIAAHFLIDQLSFALVAACFNASREPVPCAAMIAWPLVTRQDSTT
jgi:hypothetical protein